MRTFGRLQMMAVAGLILSAVLWGHARAAPYSNPDLHFSAALPDGFVACPPGSGVDHGPLVALERPRPGHCDGESLGRYIAIFAYHNVVDTERTFPEFVKSSCTDKDERSKCEKSTLDLKIGGLKSATFRERAPPGRIAIRVIAQNRQGPVLSCPTGINLWADLLTDPSHYERDLAEFRRFLKSVRTTPPPVDRKACEPGYPRAR